MQTKTAADILSELDTLDATEKSAQAEVEAQIDAFVAGVDAECKAAGLSDVARAYVWANVGSAFEKTAATQTLPPDPMISKVKDMRSRHAAELASAGTSLQSEKAKGVATHGADVMSGLKGMGVGGAAAGGLGGLLLTALQGNQEGQKKHYIRNALLGALVGGVGAPVIGGLAGPGYSELSKLAPGMWDKVKSTLGKPPSITEGAATPPSMVDPTVKPLGTTSAVKPSKPVVLPKDK